MKKQNTRVYSYDQCMCDAVEKEKKCKKKTK